ncbi:MAG: TonB-dependent receptor [Woeseiaceae bacterium]|nr:TonB-dependent receptor [Woeseiaceae bacterium]
MQSIDRLSRTCLGLSAAFGLFVVAPATAIAQDDSADEALSEITVTARRREETLQDVPIAVTAFSGDYLEEIGMPDIVGITQSTPNVTLEVSRATSTTLTAFIRGVGQQDPVAGYEGGVGIYLDDVYLARPQGVVFDIYDVERIEVLRGPQGTLYGRNTIGGAVRYVTKGLSDEAELKLKGSVGTYSQLDLIATGSYPVTDSFRIGGSLASFTRDGFGENLTTGGEHYDKDVLAGRFSAEFDASDDVQIRFSYDYSDDDSAPKSGHRLTVGNLSGAPVLDDVFDTRAGIETIPSSNGGVGQNVRQQGGQLAIDWAINDYWTFKSITADRRDESESLIDFDSLPGNDFDAPVIYENEQFSQEFQLNYTSGDISGVFGAYYIDANAFDAFDVVLGNLGVTSFTLGDFDTEAWAVFGDVSWELNDEWSLSFGGRYTSDKRSTTVTRELFAGLGSPFFGNSDAVSLTVPAPGLVPTFTGSRTDEDFTPRVSLSWKPSDTQNVYVAISEGFKGGSFDPRGAYQNPGVEEGFEPETVVSYEIGWKATLADGRATVNAAYFFTDYEDIQVPGSIGIDTDNDGVNDSFAGATTNAGKAEIKGLELESMIRVTDSLSLMGSFGYIDAAYTEWFLNDVDISGDREFQNTPEWVANLQIRKEWGTNLFGMPGSISIIGGASYKDDMFQFEIPNPLLDTEDYTLIDLSIGWRDDDGRYSLSLHGRNLTDEEYKVASYDFPTLGLEGVQSAFYGNPMTVTLTGTVNF